MKRPNDQMAPDAAARLPSWHELNREWLAGALARLAARIRAGASGPHRDVVDQGADARPAGFTPALVHCAATFGLSPFERELLLLVAGLELDQGLRDTVAAQGGERSRERGVDLGAASFGLALRLLTGPHWDALSPDAPLRHWGMLAPEPGAPLTAAALAIDERILHHLTGVAASDRRLLGIARAIPAGEVAEGADLALAKRIARHLAAEVTPAPAVALGGGQDPALERDLALAAAARLRCPVLWVAAGDIPAEPEGLELLARHLDREGALTSALVVLSVEAETERVGFGLAARLRRPFLWLGTPGHGLAARPPARRLLLLEARAPDRRTARRLLAERWRRLGVLPEAEAEDAAVLAALDRAAVQFGLTQSALEGIAERLGATPAGERAAAVWPAAREAARGGLDALAQRVETRVDFGDLVLPSGQMAVLHDIARQLRHSERVFADWGFGAKHRLGQGLVALFAGESGTGKTLAAEAIANKVALDLYRVDLATLVSKYIGETEKNLKRLFDAAETSGAVLLFDEADALFGKRSEVRDSHDRYANIEVAYLLQRIEAYRGLAILTTNMRSALDRAFLRRIRFVVTFPFPDAAARERIWRRQFPAEAPTGAIDFAALARLNLAGGNIRSVALAAAFKAADRGLAIDQALLLEAAREELAKLDRTTGVVGAT